MGNTSGSAPAKTPYGDIAIFQENNTFIAGTELSGSLLMNIYKPYPLKSVYVTICGEEVVTKSNSPNRIVLLSQDIKLVVPMVGNVVQPGRYLLPFTFLLPINLPSSFSPETIDGLVSRIDYGVKGNLISSDQKVSPMSCIERFTVKQPLVFDTNCLLAESKEISGLLGSKGSAKIETILSKNGMYHDEKITLTYNIDNSKCSEKINETKVRLFEETQVVYKQTYDVISTGKSLDIMTWTFPGCAAKAKTSQTKPLGIAPQKPGKCLDTTNGTYIQRKYFIEIIPVFDVIGGSKKMIFKYPMHIQTRPSIISPQNLNLLASKPMLEQPIPQINSPMPVQPMPGMDYPMVQPVPAMQPIPEYQNAGVFTPMPEQPAPPMAQGNEQMDGMDGMEPDLCKKK